MQKQAFIGFAAAYRAGRGNLLKLSQKTDIVFVKHLDVLDPVG